MVQVRTVHQQYEYKMEVMNVPVHANVTNAAASAASIVRSRDRNQNINPQIPYGTHIRPVNAN